MNGKYPIALGAIFAGLSVAFGAFGAHGLKGKVDEHMLDVWQTAARYQMYHAFALIALGILASDIKSRLSTLSMASFVLGTLFFSGSLYTMTLTGHRWLGALTPFGGLFLMAGWALFAAATLLSTQKVQP